MLQHARIGSLVLLILVGLHRVASAQPLPWGPEEPLSLAQLGTLCSAERPVPGENPPVMDWIAWWQQAGFCNGLHAGVVSFALSPQYDDRRTGFPGSDAVADFCSWHVLGATELSYASALSDPWLFFDDAFGAFIAAQADLADEPAVGVLLNALPEIYPCAPGKAGDYQLDTAELLDLCSAKQARLLLLKPEAAMYEIGVLYGSFGYCQGVIYGWLQSALASDRSTQSNQEPPYCLQSGTTLADLQLDLIEVVQAQFEQGEGTLPVPAGLDGLLKEALPCA